MTQQQGHPYQIDTIDAQLYKTLGHPVSADQLTAPLRGYLALVFSHGTNSRENEECFWEATFYKLP
jgi:hypothetical protein